jgi:glutamate formiminotransferase
LAARFALPVFLYEAASPHSGGVRSLPEVRRAAFRTLVPDLGPSVPHPTAGAVVVGARGPLIAYNINLTTPDVRIARTIARELREGGGSGLVGVRALGLFLESRGLAQVSMNITRPGETSLLSVLAYVTRRAGELGTSVLESEVIGALPGDCAFGIIAEALAASGLKPGQVLLENWPAM